MRMSHQSFRVKLTGKLSRLIGVLMVIVLATLTSACDKPEVQPNSAKSSIWLTDLQVAIRKSAETEKPLLVVSILGDIGKRC